jgi:hypothetical protein
MTTGTAAIQANTGASISILSGKTAGVTLPRTFQQSGTTGTGASKEDTVQLSATTQRFLQTSQTQETQAKSLVEQLVKAAAAGDSGALSLLTVI